MKNLAILLLAVAFASPVFAQERADGPRAKKNAPAKVEVKKEDKKDKKDKKLKEGEKKDNKGQKKDMKGEKKEKKGELKDKKDKKDRKKEKYAFGDAATTAAIFAILAG